MSADPGQARQAGRESLALIDRILSQRPEKDGKALTDATKQLSAFREVLIAEAQGGDAEARRRLEHCNAVLSIVAAVHFPLGPVPWDELAKARDWLSALTGSVAAG